jgi:hypothetical protein
MPGHQCYHCKQWIEAGDAHDCWTTTEAALTRDLSEDLQDAWGRLRETAAEFGDQRIYASHHSIMFSRQSCYFFVRPKKNSLEVCVFLDRAVRHPRIRRVNASSASKFVHSIQIRHRDEVEAPLTDWLKDAYDLLDRPRAKPAKPGTRAEPATRSTKAKPAGKAKTNAKSAASPRTNAKPTAKSRTPRQAKPAPKAQTGGRRR